MSVSLVRDKADSALPSSHLSLALDFFAESAAIEDLLMKGIRRLRNDGVAGFWRASCDYARNWWRRRQDAGLDRKYGVDTQGRIADLRALGASGPHARNATCYEAIQIKVFRQILRALPIDPGHYAFIDFGSGKGRAVMLAALAGFKHVVGIEFAPALHGIAQDNVARLKRARRRLGPIELVCQDVAHFVVPAQPCVCFLYNPFDAVMLRRVLNNIAASLRRHPRDLWIVYRNPVHAEVLDHEAFLTLAVDHRAFRIYRAQRS